MVEKRAVGAIIVGSLLSYGVVRRLPINIVWKEGEIVDKQRQPSKVPIRERFIQWNYTARFDDGTETTFIENQDFAQIGERVKVPSYALPGIAERPSLLYKPIKL